MKIFQDLVGHFKGQGPTAIELGVSQATVSGWCRGRHGMSPHVAVLVEKKTFGRFRRELLCPGFPWPERPATLDETLSPKTDSGECADHAVNSSSISEAQ